MKFDDDFKREIANLPSKEKDKLILRLLKKDYILANRLYFELVSTDSIQDRRLVMEDKIRKKLSKENRIYRSPKTLVSDVRSISAEITEHVRITKDKYGEASLNLLMLNETLRNNNPMLNRALPNRSHRFNVYVVARAFKILTLIKSLHEDLHMEFEDGLSELNDNFKDNHHLMQTVSYSKFDINWLLHCDIPDNIGDILKESRSLGLLK